MKLDKSILSNNKYLFLALIPLICLMILMDSNIFHSSFLNAITNLEEEGKLMITELMTSNKGAYNDSEGNQYDLATESGEKLVENEEYSSKE